MKRTIEEAIRHLANSSYVVATRKNDESPWVSIGGDQSLANALQMADTMTMNNGRNNVRLFLSVPIDMRTQTDVVDWAAELYGRKPNE